MAARPAWRQETKLCPCGTRFKPDGRLGKAVWEKRRYCSTACFMRLYIEPRRIPLTMVKCRTCGEQFHQLWRNHTFCSVDCHRNYRDGLPARLRKVNLNQEAKVGV